MEKNYESELAAQQSYVFTYKWLNGAAFILFLLIGWNASVTAFFLLAMGQVAFNVVRWPHIKAELFKRQRVVAFKLQVDNLYIFSQHPYDQSVAATFKEAADMLKEVSNKQEVRVHMAIFQDVIIQTTWTDANGRRQNERTWRDKGSGSETWEQYVAFCETFVKIDNDLRKRQLHSNPASTAHVHQFIFNQQ